MKTSFLLANYSAENYNHILNVRTLPVQIKRHLTNSSLLTLHSLHRTPKALMETKRIAMKSTIPSVIMRTPTAVILVLVTTMGTRMTAIKIIQVMIRTKTFRNQEGDIPNANGNRFLRGGQHQ